VNAAEASGPELAGGQKWLSIGLLSLCEVMALALWFSGHGGAAIAEIQYAFSDTHAALLTSSVALGFVCGTLTSAILGLSDRMAPRRLFMVSALVAAAANAAILLVEPTSFGVIAFRFVTGAFMAGIYPVGMKMAATWARKDTGLSVGMLVVALTICSTSPAVWIGALPWQRPQCGRWARRC